MVGEGVLHECLQHPSVEKILVLNRRPCGVSHPKLVEIIHNNFFDLSSIEEQLKNYDACFFCLGVSSIGMKEKDYSRITYELTLHAAETLSRINPSMIFCFVSGAATDSSEKGRVMWARVKGKTENDLIKLPFKKIYAFRPAYMHPTKGLKNVLTIVKWTSWLYYPMRLIMPQFVSTLSDVGLAMINTVNKGPQKNVLEVKDINALAKA